MGSSKNLMSLRCAVDLVGRLYKKSAGGRVSGGDRCRRQQHRPRRQPRRGYPDCLLSLFWVILRSYHIPHFHQRKAQNVAARPKTCIEAFLLVQASAASPRLVKVSAFHKICVTCVKQLVYNILYTISPACYDFLRSGEKPSAYQMN